MDKHLVSLNGSGFETQFLPELLLFSYSLLHPSTLSQIRTVNNVLIECDEQKKKKLHQIE